MTGFDDRMAGLRQRFRDRCGDRAEKLRSAMASGDAAALAAVAHDLAGSAGLFGFEELSREAQTCELAARKPGASDDELRLRGAALLRELTKIAGESTE
jgi:HPt (histidine-containing phosphotransfer) domain-containing protein